MREQGNPTDKCPLKSLFVKVEVRAAGGKGLEGGGRVRGEKVLQRNYIVCGEETGGRQADGS